MYFNNGGWQYFGLIIVLGFIAAAVIVAFGPWALAAAIALIVGGSLPFWAHVVLGGWAAVIVLVVLAIVWDMVRT